MIAIFKETPQLDFLGKKTLFLTISALFVLSSLASFWWQGLNLGLDFRGGTLVQVLFDEPIDKLAIQEKLSTDLAIPVVLNNLGGSDSGEFLLLFSSEPGDSLTTDAQRIVAKSLSEQGLDFQIRRVESIGPKIGSELRLNAWYSVLLSLTLILLYMTFRFKWYFGIGAIAALIHDTVVTVGAFSLFRIEFDLTALAGILTLVGYSMNDTIVVFDRVRENMTKHPAQSLPGLINLSVNETLSRTILTFTTTFIVILAMYIFGGESIKGFSFAFLIGMVVGTYSSVFIAGPFAIWSFDFKALRSGETVLSD